MSLKRRYSILALALAAVCLLAVGCGAAKSNQPDGNQPGGAGQGPAGVMGIVTEVSGSSITIAVMPAGAGPQGGDGRQPSGSAQPDGQGQPPAGTGQPGERPEGAAGDRPDALDTSNWEKKTYSIDSKTTVTEGQGPGSQQSGSLTVSDLKAGDSVSIVERDGAAGTAGAITVMGGMAGSPGGQPGGQPDGQPGDKPSVSANDERHQIQITIRRESL